MTTDVQKDTYGNWSARSQHEVPGHPGMTLELLTMKRFNRAISTTASVHVYEGKFKVHRAHTDFHKTVCSSADRCTQKNVEAQHNDALTAIAVIQLEAKVHYDALVKKGQS